ncbi:MAG: hypothetical protein EBQ92_10210 [Proteobacteria bacterium]|nr:hypothetical protein [Pseudomonadota bacterium]
MKTIFYFIAHYAVLTAPLEPFHLTEIHNRLQVDEAQTQEELFSGEVKAEKAVTLAIESILTDGSHVESPLALAGSREELFEHLNRPTSEINFVNVGEKPEHGESVDENWIIELRIRSLSDHIFWSVVDRAGKKPTYNYGFN